jgi:tRNA (guanine37-N1)-methyltransferase
LKFHVVTIFPELLRGPFEFGIVGQAVKAGLLEIKVHDLRDWTHDRHRTVDDRPFGGGEGMLLKPEPLFDAVESIWPERSGKQKIVLTSARGRRFSQADARSWSQGLDELLVICGRYEGVDERVAEHLVDEEVSIGDYVLSGGELAAAIIVDATARLLPGVLGNDESARNESYSVLDVEREILEGRRIRGAKGKETEAVELLDCPQYTRPAEFRGWKVPDVLLGGNHAEIRKWRLRAALERTRRLRPDLIEPVKVEEADGPGATN